MHSSILLNAFLVFSTIVHQLHQLTAGQSLFDPSPEPTPTPTPSECTDCSDSSAPTDYTSGNSHFYQYNTVTGEFVFRDPYIAPDGATASNGCLVGDKTRFNYYVGGFQSFDNGTTIISDLVQRFDYNTLSWTVLTPVLNVARAHATCHHFARDNAQGILFVISGLDSDLNYLHSIEYLDLNDMSQGWVLLENEYGLKTPRISAKTVTDAVDNIWIMGGFDGTQSLRSIEALQVLSHDSCGISVSMNKNFGNLAVSRASFAVGQYAMPSGYSCVFVIGGRSGQIVGAQQGNTTATSVGGKIVTGLKELDITDKVEYLCYQSPPASNCFESVVVSDTNVFDNDNQTWLDICEIDAWLINVKDDVANGADAGQGCEYHAITYYDELVESGDNSNGANSSVINLATCYHGPFGKDTQSLTRMFEINETASERSAEGRGWNIGISLKYYTFCAFDSNEGDVGYVYFNGEELLWTGTHEFNDCSGVGGWQFFNWTDTFMTWNPYLYRCVDDGDKTANIDDLACVAEISVNVTDYNSTKFSVTVAGTVSEKDEIKNWGFSNLQIRLW